MTSASDELLLFAYKLSDNKVDQQMLLSKEIISWTN